MRISEITIPLGLSTMGKVRAGFHTTGSAEMDDSMSGDDIEKEQAKYVKDKKKDLSKIQNRE